MGGENFSLLDFYILPRRHQAELGFSWGVGRGQIQEFLVISNNAVLSRT